MRRIFLVVLMICLFGVATSAALAQNFSETYTSPDGRMSISYPGGWFINESMGSFTLSTVEEQNIDPEARLEPGTAAIGFMVSDEENYDFLSILNGDTPVEMLEELLSLLQENSFDPDMTLPLSTPVPLMIGDYEAARTASTYKGSRNQFVIFLMKLDADTFAFVVGLTAADEMVRVEPKFIDIAATLRYSSVPAVEAGNPINVDMLAPLTKDNAVSLIPLSTVRGHRSRLVWLALSPDGSQLVSGGQEDGQLYVWDVRTGERRWVLEQHRGSVKGLTYSPDGTYFASLGSDDGTVRVWDAATGEQVYSAQKTGSLWYVAFSPDSQSIAYISFVQSASGVLNSSSVWLWNFETEEETLIKSLRANQFANSITFNAEGTRILFSAGEHNRGDEFGVWVYDVEADEIILEKTGQGNPIDVFFTAGDDPIVSLMGDDSRASVELWNAESETVMHELEEAFAYQTLLNPTRDILGTLGTDEEARLYDVESGRLLTTLEHNATVYGLAYSLDGRVVATADEQGTIYLWGVPLE